MTGELLFRGRKITFRSESASDRVAIELDGQRHEFELTELAPSRLMLRNARGGYAARVVRDRDRICVWLDGRTFEFRLPASEEARVEAAIASGDEIRAPMPGTLVKLLVNAGDAVEEGQVVAVVEAMKMEHALRAPRAGVVQRVSSAVGMTVDTSDVIVELRREQ